MNPPPPLPPVPGSPYANLFLWGNHLLAFVLSLVPIQSSSIKHDRTSRGVIYRVAGKEEGAEGGPVEPAGKPRWG